MAHYLSDAELERTAPADAASFKGPVPTQIVSNGEFNPLPQTRQQRRLEARIKALADTFGRRHRLTRRRFLASSAGMAAAFLAMNGKYGVTNVYAEIGSSFANSAVANPRFAAALMGTLVRGLGADHVVWGTDSVWYGSPQWQIEAMRRLEIPDDMRKKHGFAPLGPADGLVKSAIFSGNSARLYKIGTKAAQSELTRDKIAAIKTEYAARGGLRSNTRYGYVSRVTV